MGKSKANGGTPGRRPSGRGSKESPEPDVADDPVPEVPAGPRRTGRHASTPTTTPVPETSKKGVTSKSAPPKARATPPSSTGGRKRASTGTKRSRLAQEGEGDAGGARLRKRGSVSFKEPSDDEALEGGSGADSGSDREDGPEPEPEPIESDVDVTVYSPPAAAALPEMVELRAAAGDKPALTVPSSALGDLMAAYAILRSFSWQLRLSPFTFEDFCAAMCSTQPTLLVDETHVCVLRALTADEVPTERAEHKLDLGLLDTITWPCYVWEMLRITEDPLAAHEWEHRKVPRVPEPAATPGTAAKDKSATPAAAPASGSAPNTAPTEGADRVEKAAETPGTGGNAVADGDAATPAEAAPNDSADPTPSAKVPEGSAPEAASPPFAAASQPQSRVPFSPVAVEVMDEQLKETVETTAGGHFGDHGPRPFRHQPEYYALPVELKAAILSRLCDHLMDSTTIRAEIDRREAGGEFVSGKGGEGGAFAIMTPEEKARAEAHAKKQQQSDANTDICVLCGLGGNLLCCDGCPAAYHLRCLGETGKNLGEGDWLCPECVVGGRGETAGLRIPVAARNKWKQPHYIVNGAVIQEALPAVKGSGRHAIELTQRVPAAVYPAGSAAEAALEAATKVRSGDEMPLPSTFEAVSDPPKWPEEASSAGADGYMNKYRNGWSAAVTAVRSAVEDAKRRRHKGGIWVPTGTCGRLGVPELPEPLPLSKFQWVLPQGRPMGRATTRCGKCHTCMRPTLRKGCLNPIFKAGTVLEDAQPDTSKLAFMIAYVAKVEREFWALAEGPWASEPGGGMQFRARWASSVRSASSAADLANCLLQLETSLRPVAFSKEWLGEGPVGGLAAGAQGDDSNAGSRAMSRATSAADLQGAAASMAGSEDAEDDGTGGQRVDPYDLRATRLSFGDWEMNRRHHAAHILSVNRLPSHLLRKAARAAGRKMIPGIRYRKYKWTLNSPRMQWVAEAEAVQTCAQLAIAVRKLDAVLQWDAVSKPRGGDNVPFSNAVIHAKRPAADGTGSEYLVENKITSFAEHAAAFAAMQQAPQQQLAALLLQQRIAMGHAFAIAQAQAQQAQQAQQAGISAPIPGRLGSLNQWGPQQAGGSASFAAAQWGAPRPFTLPGAPTYSFQQPGMLMPGSSTPQAAPAAANAAAAHPSAVAPAEEPGTKQEDTVMAEAPPVAPASVSGAPAMASVADAAPAVVGPSQPAPSPVGGVGVLMQVEPNAATAVAPPAAFMGMPGAAPMPAFGAISPEGFMVPFHMLPAQFAASMAAAPQQPAPSPAQEPQEEDTAALARKIVAQAIEKAVKEEEMAEAPAAMAAKMRNRQSSGAMGASGNLGDVAQGAVKTEGQGAASVPTGLPPKPPTPAPAVPLPGAPTWTHERDLPLWFIRTYEEKCRREAANAAAKELQVAARSRQLQQDSVAQAAARQAAHEAAAAAADACGVCAAAQGDNPELDALWICCDACNRWFHGECVAMSQDDVDAIPDDDPWNCPGCRIARRKAERAARREGKPGVTPFSPSEGDTKKVGRPPKPFYERADYKAGEQKALERLKRGVGEGGATPGSAGKKGVDAKAEEEAAAKRAERHKRKKEAEAKAASEPPPPVHCPVCQAPDYGRPLVECDACSRWFHYECVGTAIEDVEVAVSRGQELRCAECQGKRVRPPSQAAIDAAIIAAQDRGDFGSMAPRAKRPKHAGQPSGRSAGTPGGVPDIAWAGTAAKVLAKVSRLPAAAAFCLPVDPEEVPDYHDVVRHPMDLGTLRDRVPRMASPLEVVAGINQIVENSVLYNGEDSEYTGAAKEMRTGFQRLWTKEGLPLNQQQWQEAKAAARRAAAGAATPQARVKTFTAPVPAGGVPAADWQARVARVLGTVSRLKSAIHFVEPVPRGFMNYHDVIERPMDLGTVSKRLARGQYSDPQQVAADVALIWRNCRTFNEPDAPVVQDCAHAEASFNRNWVNAGVYEVPGGAGPSGTHRLAKSSASTGADWKESAKKVLYRTINFVPQATWFAEPVSEADVPDYRQVIKHPMDLGTVSQKLRADRYSSPQELLADVSLIWANARQYNGPDHEVTKMAETTAAAMQRYWTAAGLPGVPTPRPSAFTSASNGVNDVGLGGAGSVFQPVRSGGPVGSSRAGPPSLAAPLGDWLSAARSVVDAVLRHPSAWPFAEPVDEEEYPEYRQMVAHPMDFGTIRMRLCRGQYRSPAAVLEDARLIFDNCKEFNPRESEVWSMGVEVEAAFKQAWLAAGLSQ